MKEELLKFATWLAERKAKPYDGTPRLLVEELDLYSQEGARPYTREVFSAEIEETINEYLKLGG